MVVSERVANREYQGSWSLMTHRDVTRSAVRSLLFARWGASQRLTTTTSPVVRGTIAGSGERLSVRNFYGYMTEAERVSNMERAAR